jgi:uncharacterized membrane protein
MARTVVAIGLCTALVAVSTMVFRLDIPATKGYFNLGDAAIFISALLLGPSVGMLAGGVGSAIADVIGYPVFAPGTLVVKGIEGLMCGVIFRRLKSGGSRKASLALAGGVLALGAAMSIATSALGTEMDIALGNPFAQFSIVGVVGWDLWAVLLILFGLALAYVAVRKGESSAATISCAVAGLEMVAGYFLYEQLLLAVGILPGILPIAEVFPNMAQALIGAAVAVPTVDQIVRATRARS